MIDAVQCRVLDEGVSECDRHEAAHPFVWSDEFVVYLYYKRKERKKQDFLSRELQMMRGYS